MERHGAPANNWIPLHEPADDSIQRDGLVQVCLHLPNRISGGGYNLSVYSWILISKGGREGFPHVKMEVEAAG